VLFESPVRPLLPDFGPFPNDGGLFTVDVANFDLFADTFEQHAGPNVRIATELDPKGVRSRMVIPGGQTDRPALVAGAQADPHYMDQVPAWLANAPGDQPFSDDEVNKAAKRRLVFSK
jgi:acyl-homoserine lactone acylase PvdQ